MGAGTYIWGGGCGVCVFVGLAGRRDICILKYPRSWSWLFSYSWKWVRRWCWLVRSITASLFLLLLLITLSVRLRLDGRLLDPFVLISLPELHRDTHAAKVPAGLGKCGTYRSSSARWHTWNTRYRTSADCWCAWRRRRISWWRWRGKKAMMTRTATTANRRRSPRQETTHARHTRAMLGININQQYETRVAFQLAKIWHHDEVYNSTSGAKYLFEKHVTHSFHCAILCIN